MLIVTVQDLGVGIDENECLKLFKPFFRTNNARSRRLNPIGNGLGLYICKLICEGLNGYIQVSSELGKGSKFKFTMKVDTVY